MRWTGLRTRAFSQGRSCGWPKRNLKPLSPLLFFVVLHFRVWSFFYYSQGSRCLEKLPGIRGEIGHRPSPQMEGRSPGILLSQIPPAPHSSPFCCLRKWADREEEAISALTSRGLYQGKESSLPSWPWCRDSTEPMLSEKTAGLSCRCQILLIWFPFSLPEMQRVRRGGGRTSPGTWGRGQEVPITAAPSVFLPGGALDWTEEC